LWAKTWGGAGDEGVNRIAVGPDGYIYVTGGTDSFGAGWFDVFLLKLDSSGNLIWAKTWGGDSFEDGYDLGFDQAGNVYVAAESYTNGNCAVILKFASADGSLMWSTSWKGPATYDAAYGLAVDSNFNVIIAGVSWDYSVNPNHNSILLVKYDSSGNYIWSQNWVTPVPGEDDLWGRGEMITTDSSDNILVGATHSNDCQNSDFTQCPFSALLLKLDPSGSFLWAKTWGGSGFNTAGGLALDGSGHVLVSGTEGSEPPYTGFVLSYDAAGDLLSATGWSDEQTSMASIAVSKAGSVAVVGTAQDNSGNWQAASAPAGSLPNSLVSNPYALGTPTGQTTSLTNPTRLQTGPENTGGVFVTSYPQYGSVGPFLSFPLPNRTAFTAAINAVFDHSADVAPGSTTQLGYCADNIVTAYTGEQGMSPYPSSLVGSDFKCDGTPVSLYGYEQANGNPFSVRGQYTGDKQPQFLFYDGHPGIDYRTTDQISIGKIPGEIPVLAAAAGKVVCINIQKETVSPCMEGGGEIMIDHGNGYFTIYLHLSSAAPGLAVNSFVTAGQEIGISGAIGSEGGPHLHFEVREGVPGSQCLPVTSCVPVDPYGWAGTGPDPYTRAINLNLWQ
jgi:murein DD-endopeptidase MepM/ murein hydrolase activator NlpD